MGVEILETLRTLGVTVEVIGPDRLGCQPASRIPSELVTRIREAKAEILAMLRPLAATVSQSECRHCNGTGGCSCPACTLRRTEKVVPCLMCHPMERQVWLAASRHETCWHCQGSGKCGCISCGESEVCRICGALVGKRARAN